jgi:hypothetical protein
MTEVPAPQRPSYDFLKPLTYVFEDPKWVEKVLYGALFSLAGIVLIGAFFVYGYLARLVRNCVAGLEHPLPEWNELGDMFTEGLLLFVATLLYAAPLIFLVILTIPFSVLSGVDNTAAQIGGTLGSIAVSLILVPAGFALGIWMPGALLNASIKRDFRAAFEFRVIWDFIRNNAVNYILAYLGWLVARMAAPLGLLLCCIGIFATSFWSLLVGVYAFSQAYRMGTQR